MLASCVSKSQKEFLSSVLQTQSKGEERKQNLLFLICFWRSPPQENDLKTTKKRMKIIKQEVKVRGGKMAARGAMS